MCKRKDGTKLKDVDPILRMTSYIMPYRYDAQVFSKTEVNCEKIDQFIREEREKDSRFTYMHIVIAGLVRMYAERPKMNRFIINRKVYSRNGITLAFTVKKTLKEDAPETTLKLEFKGTENIYEIRDMIDNAIKENFNVEDQNNTDKLAQKLLSLPNFFLKFVMKFVRFLDNHGMLPQKLINASPFHVSCFLTNMKSISTSYVYHHIYDFGTVGQFISMGKETKNAIIDENDEVKVAKMMPLGLVIDERICDGLYYAHAIKTGVKYIENPYLMKENLENIVEDNGK